MCDPDSYLIVYSNPDLKGTVLRCYKNTKLMQRCPSRIVGLAMIHLGYIDKIVDDNEFTVRPVSSVMQFMDTDTYDVQSKKQMHISYS